VALLDHSLKEKGIAHAFLLLGPHHIGKRTLALNLAQALNCDDPKPPCGHCHSCQRILEQKHSDVIIIGLNSSAEISIDNMRELHSLAKLPPYEGKCKAFIIDDSEYLSSEAANSLLKILEEPPPKLVWLLLAAEERRLLPTIISRCQRLELKPVPTEKIEKMLIDLYKVDPAQAKLLARLSQGCPGWALSALKDDDILKLRAQRIARLSSLLTTGLEQRFTYAQELATQFTQDRKPVIEVIEIWLSWWRDLMLMKGSCKEAITNIDYEADLRKQAEALSLNQTKEFLANLRSIREELFKNVNPRLAFELLMLNLPRRTKNLAGV